MKYKPHSYQEYAIRYIETHPISALLIDMGLGKTSITLTAICNLLFDSFEVCKVLVIAPLRVAKNTWTDEIKKWEHLSTLTYSLIVGNENERLSALNEKASVKAFQKSYEGATACKENCRPDRYSLIKRTYGFVR